MSVVYCTELSQYKCDGDILHFKQWYWPKTEILKVSQKPPFLHTAELLETLESSGFSFERHKPIP